MPAARFVTFGAISLAGSGSRRAIYSVGLIVKLAIDGLEGEHDADFAYCLGWNVLDPVAAQLKQLSNILVKLGVDEISLL